MFCSFLQLEGISKDKPNIEKHRNRKNGFF